MMESMGAAYAPKSRMPLQMPMQPQGRYNMKPIGGGTLRPPTLPTLGGGMVKSPGGWGQSGPGQGGMIPAPMPKQGGGGFVPTPYPRNGGGGIMNPRPTKGGMSGMFHPLGSAPTMKGPMRGRKF